MWDTGRPRGRLFYWLLTVMVAAGVSQAAPLALTTISDVVYRADGTRAAGTLLISWPAFTTANNEPVAAGSKSVPLGPQGALTVDLAPNAGATPAGTFYTVVFQLDDGTVKTEYWTVGTTSPTTIAAVRTTPGSATAAQMATRQYVDSAVAAKASDTAVVHKSGSETIDGAKQFSAPPSVPAPLLAADAANKAYVDAAVAAAGGGSYVNKTGDTMTGPLTLSGDPTAPYQAATRHYVDSGLTGKASLVGGTVPVSQLGGGTPDTSKCLKGDGTWGGCGSSANAVQIQSRNVAATAPNNGQALKWNGGANQWEPGDTGGGSGLTPGMQAIKYATDYSWTASPTDNLSTAGANTVTLGPCPKGVKGSESEYWVYIAGTGTAEAVKVTGGTCTGDGATSGTLQFTTANAHAAGYTLSSASSGLQEASIDARIVPTNPTGSGQAGKVIAPPGEFDLRARVSIRSSNQTIDFSGSIANCYMSDTCLMLGDPASSTSFQDITILNFRGRPMVDNGTYAMIEDNANASQIMRPVTRNGCGAAQGCSNGGTFGYMVKVDNDQAAVIDGIDPSLGGPNIRCDSTFCGSVIYAPGPFSTNAAVLWVKNSNITLNCKGNGIDNQAGNTLHVSDSVIQGQAQFGVRSGAKTGGFGGTLLTNSYLEAGGCANPLYGAGTTGGQAGIIEQGYQLSTHGGEVQGGNMPTFANNASGATEYDYYVVLHNTAVCASCVSVPLPIGKSSVNSGTVSSVTVQFPGTNYVTFTSYDLLRVTGPTNALSFQMPFDGTAQTIAVATGRTTADCTANVCTYTDTNAALSSYTVDSVLGHYYYPLLKFWPGGIVLSSGADSQTETNLATYTGDSAHSISVNEAFFDMQNVVQQGISGMNPGQAPSPKSPGSPVITASSAIQFGQEAFTRLCNSGAVPAGLKGCFNSFAYTGTAPMEVFTFWDSTPQKNWANVGNRAAMSANDIGLGMDTIGFDSTATGFLRFPSKFHFYINKIPNAGASNWDIEWGNPTTLKVPLVTAASTTSKSGLNLPSGVAPTTPVSGDLWNESGLLKLYNGAATKTVAYTDSNITGTAGGLSANIAESQVTNLIADLAGKLGDTGPQTFSGDLTVTGKLLADSLQSTGAGAWSVEGAYGTMTAAATGKSKLGFDANGKLAVSENAGAVTEVAKKAAQEFTYTFFDATNPLTTALQVPSIYVNRAAAFHIVEVYCEIDAGSATVNLQTSGANILSSDLACTTAGAATTGFAAGKDAIAVGQKVNHVTVAASGALHRMNVVVKYTVD